MQGARPRPVKTVPLYLKNIKVNGDDNDSKIGTMVVDYAKSRYSNVNNCYIIRYRGRATIIGYTRMILDDYVEVALRRETWPEHIVCRRCERPEVWNTIRAKRKH